MADLARRQVGRLDDLPPDRGVLIKGRVAVFRCGDEVLAVDGVCPHLGGNLADGFVRDCVVTCPRHWWRFDLRTGQRLGAPAIELRRHDVSVEDGEVAVAVPTPEPKRSWREILLD